MTFNFDEWKAQAQEALVAKRVRRGEVAKELATLDKELSQLCAALTVNKEPKKTRRRVRSAVLRYMEDKKSATIDEIVEDVFEGDASVESTLITSLKRLSREGGNYTFEDRLLEAVDISAEN